MKLTTAVPITIISSNRDVQDWRVRLVHRIYSVPTSGRSIPIEGMRGFSVLLVFFVHFHALFGTYAQNAETLWHPSRFLGVIGNTGVDFFFVLSGYLIYGGLIRKKTGVISFLGRRVERIYPTFVVVLVLYLILSTLFPRASKLSGYSRIGLIIYVSQNLLLLPGVFKIKPIITLSWSLSYELCFYLIIVLLIRGTSMSNWRRIFRFCCFASLSVTYLVTCFLLSWPHARAVMFVFGILLYEALGFDGFRRMLTRPSEVAVVSLFLGGIAFIYFARAHYSWAHALPTWRSNLRGDSGVLFYEGPYQILILGSGIFLILAFCLGLDGLLKRLFSILLFRYLGNMSYSYYLIHGVALQGVALIWSTARGSLIDSLLFVLALPVGFAATWVCATALFMLVEKPCSLRLRGGSK